MVNKSVEQGSFPSSMQAWTHTKPGHPKDILTLKENFPFNHDLKPNEVFIKISHCGFNAGVVLIMEIIPSWLFKSPKIPELDFSGSILATTASPSRTDLPVGTQVFGSIPPDQVFRHGRGTLAEYVVLPSNTVMPIPTNMPPERAACLSGCAFTSLQIVRKANLQPGDTVLIHGGSGLGSIFVQVVRATVGPTGHLVATCSKPNIPFVTSLGADEVIDYTAHPSLAAHLTKTYGDTPAKLDAILDIVYTSPSLYTSSPTYLKSSGLYLNAGGMGMPHRVGPFIMFFFSLLLNYIYPSFLPGSVNRRFAFLSGNANEKDHREVKRLVESGELRVELNSVWGMGEELRAYERIESRRARGKVVVMVG